MSLGDQLASIYFFECVNIALNLALLIYLFFLRREIRYLSVTVANVHELCIHLSLTLSRTNKIMNDQKNNADFDIDDKSKHWRRDRHC